MDRVPYLVSLEPCGEQTMVLLDTGRILFVDVRREVLQKALDEAVDGKQPITTRSVFYHDPEDSKEIWEPVTRVLRADHQVMATLARFPPLDQVIQMNHAFASLLPHRAWPGRLHCSLYLFHPTAFRDPASDGWWENTLSVGQHAVVLGAELRTGKATVEVIEPGEVPNHLENGGAW